MATAKFSGTTSAVVRTIDPFNILGVGIDRPTHNVSPAILQQYGLLHGYSTFLSETGLPIIHILIIHVLSGAFDAHIYLEE